MLIVFLCFGFISLFQFLALPSPRPLSLYLAFNKIRTLNANSKAEIIFENVSQRQPIYFMPNFINTPRLINRQIER